MKAVFFIAILALAPIADADTYVKGYVKKNGTVVQPHWRSDSDDTKLNNYSTKGNVNPYTGKSGTVDPWNTNSKSKFSSED